MPTNRVNLTAVRMFVALARQVHHAGHLVIPPKGWGRGEVDNPMQTGYLSPLLFNVDKSLIF